MFFFVSNFETLHYNVNKTFLINVNEQLFKIEFIPKHTQKIHPKNKKEQKINQNKNENKIN